MLSGSRGRLFFDTEAGGAGTSMYQPLYAGADSVGLEGVSEVVDGSETVTLRFSRFAPGRTFSFFVDVDDRFESSPGGSAIITGIEIEGAEVIADFTSSRREESRARGQFSDEGTANVRAARVCA